MKEGDKAPDLSLADGNGMSLPLADLKGQERGSLFLLEER